jgi:HD-GYP domain-containing protein (c-di-GMP phosphodiesterase class II)
LREEFGVSFTFYDAVSGLGVAGAETGSTCPSTPRLGPESVIARAADERARVTALANGHYQITLLIYVARKPALVAEAEFDMEIQPAENGAARREREEAMLRGWVQAVSDRLRLADQMLSRRSQEEAQNAQNTTAWEALLALDQLQRSLRVNRDSVKNHERVLESALSLLKVQALVWVPAPANQPVVVRGETGLTLDECRDLARTIARSPEFRAPAPLLCNQVPTTTWGPHFPPIENLLALCMGEQRPLGWLIALNKCGAHPFRRSDAALLLPFSALLELHLRWTHRYQDLKDLLVGLTRSLTAALDAKDSYTYGHSERVARIGVELGRELGLEEDDLGDIYLAGLLHDVGKIGIRDEVLNKPGPLSPEEYQHVQEHVIIGYSILAELGQIRSLLPGVLYHHERYDGGGYPDGLAGEHIPLLARIMAVADAYDAMSHQRPYRDSIPQRRVEELLLEGAGTQWDRQVVNAFFSCRQRIHSIRQRGLGDSLRQAIDVALRSHSVRLRRVASVPGASPTESAES